jgi:pyruvate-formate lyase-activating enzyme
MQRLTVMPPCTPRCPSCTGCTPSGIATLESILEQGELDRVLLGGGDATRWPSLDPYLVAVAARPRPPRVFLEAPAASFTSECLERLAAGGVAGIVVLIEGVGPEMTRVMNVGDGEAVIAAAEALGLETQARVLVRPKTFRMVAPLARRLAPRQIWLELVRNDWGKTPIPIWPGMIEELLLAHENVAFSTQRRSDAGYLPPCALPEVWKARPTAFRTVLGGESAPCTTFEACGRCTIRTTCSFRDAGALTPDDQATLHPIVTTSLPWAGRPSRMTMPAHIVAKRREPDVICTTPWTTLEIVDPNGLAYQCCTTWTVGSRGSVLESSIADVWNGNGYRSARRIMSGGAHGELCYPICSRLHDRAYAEKRFEIQLGSKAFVDNQLLIAEDIAERREVTRAKPISMALCPSTYCNYDCIMCNLGRTPRRELPESIWDELPAFLPTLRTLTLLGGEPLANPSTMRFLREFDTEKHPDCSIDFVTNGSLLNEATLSRMSRCKLGDVTVSLNAGTAEVYERVQRGIAFERVLENLDALLRFRAAHHSWFGVTTSFVVQPASAHTLIQFGEIAHARNLRIRLLALNPEDHEGLDFYLDDAQVASVLDSVDRFIEWAKVVHPAWLPEIRAVRTAVLGEARERQGLGSIKRPDQAERGNLRRLPVLGS